MLQSLSPIMTALSLAAVAAWIYLIGFRGAFWMSWRYHDLDRQASDQRDEAPKAWPAVVAIVPARACAINPAKAKLSLALRLTRSILDARCFKMKSEP